MLFQQQVGLPVAQSTTDTFWIVGEIYHSILYSLKVGGLGILFIEHSILPACSRGPVQSARAFICLKLVPIVCVLDEKLHMPGDVDMDYYRSIVLYVEV
jgi:hypothetical protein